MTQSKDDQESNSLSKTELSKPDFIKQLRQEMHLDDDEDGEGATKSIGSTVAYLRTDGKIEVITCIQHDGVYSDGACVVEPGTPEFDAVLQEHGPLVEGKPHSIKIYPPEEQIKSKSAREHNSETQK